MSGASLVNPVRLARAGALPAMVPPLLRAAAAGSRSLLGGRGIGYGCTVAADLIGKDGQLGFQLAGGGTFTVLADDRYWLPYLLLEQCYETDLDHFLSRTLTARDSFLDCGSNLGLWSIAASRVIGDAGRVVAVEAGSRTYAQLKRNWEANRRSFTILHRAVGPTSGERISFFASAGDHASATTVANLSPRDAQEESVTTVSLPDLIAEQKSRQAEPDALTFVKLDIEGMERQVFSTIDPDRDGSLAVLYEDHGSEADHVTAFVLDRGFHAAFLADDGSIEPIRRETLGRLDELKTNPARGYNLLAFAPKGTAASRLGELFGWTGK